MPELILDKPNEKQDLFLRDHHRHVGYGGARGGGKSWSVRTKAKLLCVKHPGIRVCIVRRTYPELEANHIRVLVPEVEDAGLAKYNKTDKRLTWINGSTIDFRFAQREDDLRKFQGNEWDIIFIDEATQWSEQELKKITACCRGANNFPKRIYYTCNPGGIGHAYIKRIFIDRKFEDTEVPDDYTFIQARVTDNDALMDADPEYIKMLQALPPKLRQAWLDGDWDTMSGVFFEEFRDDPEHYADRKWTHVIEPFDIPLTWRIERSYDFGYSKPFSLGYWAIDPEGRMYRFLEWYGWNGIPNEGMKWTPEQQFKYIANLERTHPWLKGRTITGVADPAIWESSSGVSVAETASRHGILFHKGDNARIPGWMQCHYRLTFDENGIPMMYVFKNCKNFIRCVPLQQYDETKIEDLNSDLEDHCCDEWRYEMMQHVIKPVVQQEKQIIGDDPLNMHVPKTQSVYISHGY